MTDTKKVEVVCECAGTGYYAVADGPDDYQWVECAEHNPAYQQDPRELK